MKKKTFGFGAMIAGAILAVTSLTGCSKSSYDDQPVEENAAVTDGGSETPMADPAPSLAPATTAEKPILAAPSPKTASETPVAPDAQMLDDADATGMTARVPRDQASANTVAAQ